MSFAWVVSHDVAFFNALQQACSESFDCQLELATDAQGTLDALRQQARPLLLVDSRPGHVTKQTELLLGRLSRAEVPTAQVLSLGTANFPSAVAAELDLLANVHVNLSLGELREVMNLHRDWFCSPNGIRIIPESRRIQTQDLDVVTYTPEFFPVVDDLIRVASRDVTLLLVGETGTGKTTLARLVHELSSRKNRQFQHLACGALPSDLIESELFGHTRGAFTGADRTKIGRFEAAGHGTLLLDEIDVLDLKQQTKLLKVIETGEYEMVGSAEPRKSNARLIVASNVNLKDLTEDGRFRSDLYYRLNVLEFRLPALRDRTLDVAFLAMQFVTELCSEHGITIHEVQPAFLDALRKYDWPGNLREMKNHMRRAVLFCQDGNLTVNDLSHTLIRAQFHSTNGHKPTLNNWTLAERVAQSEREMLEEALRANGNNRTKTARALGISRVGLYKKMQRLGIIESRMRTG